MFWPRTIVTSQIQAGARVFGRAGWVFFIIAILTTLVPAQAQADELNKAQWLMRQSEQAFSLQLVTLSSTEAEYVAAAEVTSEVLFLRALLADIGFPQHKPTKIYEDNKSCIHMLYGTGHHQRTKHINGKYHFSKQ